MEPSSLHNAFQVRQVRVLVVVEEDEVNRTGGEPVLMGQRVEGAPTVAEVPTTHVTRSATPACSQMRRALAAFASASSTEYTLAAGAALAMRSAP